MPLARSCKFVPRALRAYHYLIGWSTARNTAPRPRLLLVLALLFTLSPARAGYWANSAEVSGQFTTAQGVCDARGANLGYPLVYVSRPDTALSGYCLHMFSATQGWLSGYSNYYPHPPSCPHPAQAAMDNGHGKYVCQRGSPAAWAGTPVNQIAEYSCPVGNPILPGSGAKLQPQFDYLGAGPHPLMFARLYRSSYFNAPADGLGPLWQHSWDRRLDLSMQMASSPLIVATRGDGSHVHLVPEGSIWRATGATRASLTPVRNGSGSLTGWSYLDADTDSRESYDSAGKLQAVSERNGWTTSLTYSSAATAAAIAPRAGLLIDIRNQFGRSLRLTYNKAEQLLTLTAPGEEITRYSYDANGMLASVIGPDGKGRRYLYDNRQFVWALTGMTDELGNRLGTYAYDSQGRAISTEHAGDAGPTWLQYLDNGQTVVTLPDGSSRSYGFQLQDKELRPSSIATPGGTYRTSYDASGRVVSEVDAAGMETRHAYDAQGREIQVVTAAGTAQAQTTSILWHPIWNLPLKIAAPGEMAEFSYDGKGQMTSFAGYATDDKSGSQGLNVPPRKPLGSIAWTYDANGLISSKEVKTENVIAERWTYAYNLQGNLVSVANSQGQVVKTAQYDAKGRFLGVFDVLALSREGIQASEEKQSPNIQGNGHPIITDGPRVLSSELIPEVVNRPENLLRIPSALLPSDPTYGPANCIHYPSNSVLRKICEGSGSDPNTNCARKCLKDKYPIGNYSACKRETPPIMDPWYWRDHPVCWFKCQWGPFAQPR